MALTKKKPAMCDTAGSFAQPRLATRIANHYLCGSKNDRNRIMLTRIRRTIADIRSALSPFASAVDRRVVGTLITFFGR